jgi:predicted MFS family arabinose efflux permease
MINNKEDLPNALALNSAMVNIARLVGPALSGIVLNEFGAGICFSVNAISFVAVICSLLLMKLPAFQPPLIKKKVITDLAEGFVYLKNTPLIGLVMLMLVLLSLFVLPYDTMMPVFAKVVYNGNAATFGYISSFIGLGAIMGSLVMASVKDVRRLKVILLLSVAILGAGLIFFSRIQYLPAAMPFAVIIGFGSLSPMTAGITIIQMQSAPEMRGRVMSYVAMAYFGMLPLGSLLTGSVSQKISAPLTMLCQGVFALVIAAIFSKYLSTKSGAQPDGKKTEKSIHSN